MNPKERLKNYPLHESIRGYFGYELYKHMERNNDTWLVSIDLGYGLFNAHFEDFPERCINTGAAEESALDICVGLALSGKLPVVYSITPFLLWRAAEVIRLYIDHENIPVKLIGSGRDKDYSITDGFSHDATDAKDLLALFPNIAEYWPESKEKIAWVVKQMLDNGYPTFVSLKR